MRDRRRWSRRGLLAAGAGLAGALAGCAGATGGTPEPTPAGTRLETVLRGLRQPWAVEVLDAGRALVTELPGRLRLVDLAAGTAEQVRGVPKVRAAGQGGLLDVTADGEWVYLTYALPGDGGSTTALGRGRLVRGGGEPRLASFERLFVAEPFVEDDRHYGSRVAVREGEVYVTVGDRHFKNFGPKHTAQRLDTDHGAVHRLHPDGSVPADNPFIDEPGARGTIYSYGHRNPQGLAVHPVTGALWESEHGERDGDELNVLEAGANYGWPVADEGCRYGTDERVGVSHDERADVTAPAHTWPCGTGGFPPAGMTVYGGDRLPWRGELLVGTLAGQYLGRFALEGASAEPVGRLLEGRYWRVRDVTTGPDGLVYAVVDGASAPLVRFVPA